MSRGKKAAIITGMVVGALIGFSLLLPHFLNVDKYRNLAARIAGDKINRQVTIDHLKLSIWGGLGVELRNLTVSDREGSGNVDFISAKRVKVEVKVLPLLKKRWEVKQILLEEPVVLLVLYPDGSYNFSDIINAGADARINGQERARVRLAAQNKPTPEPAQLAGALIISKLSIKDGTITFVDKHSRPGSELVTRISDIDLKVEDISPDSPFSVVLKAVVGETKKQNLSLKGKMLIRQKEGGFADFDLKIDAKDLELSPLLPYLSKNLPLRLEGGRFSANLRLHGSTREEVKAGGEISLRQLRASVKGNSPLDLNIGIQEGITYNPQKAAVNINTTRMTFGESELIIRGDVSNLKEAPEVNLRITSDNFDLDSMSLLYPPLKDKLPRELKLGGKAAFSVNLSGTAEKLTTRGTVELANASVGYSTYFQKTALQPMKVDFQATMEGETLRIDDLNTDLGELQFEVSGTVKTKPAPVLNLKFSTSSITMETLKAFVPALEDKRVKGNIKVEGTVRGPVDKPQEINFRIKAGVLELGRMEDLIRGFPEISKNLPRELALKGVISAEITASGSPAQLKASGKALLNDLEINYGENFHKPAGFPLEAEFDITRSGKGLTIKMLKLRLGEMSAQLSGVITDFEKPRVDLRLTTDGFPLDQLSRLVPAAKAYNPGGRAALNLRVNGEARKPRELSATGDISLSGVRIEFPDTGKTLHGLNGKILLSGSNARIREMSLFYGKTAMRLEADVEDFSKPNIIFSFQSPLFLAEDFLTPGKAGNGKSLAAKMGEGKEKSALPVKALKGLYAEGSVNIGRLVHKKVELTELEAKIKMSEGVLTADPVSFNIYGGRFQGVSRVDMSSGEPEFRVIADLNNVDVKRALQGQGKLGKIMRGRLSSSLDISGTGMGFESISRTLKGKGNVRIERGSFTNFSLLNNLSLLTGFAGLNISNRESTPFDLLKGEFNLAEGRVNTHPVTLSFGEYGLSASGHIGLDKSLAYEVQVTLGEALSRKIGGGGVGAFFMNRQGRMVVPLTLKGTISKPTVSVNAEFVQKKLLEYGGRKLQDQFMKGSKTGLPDILGEIFGGSEKPPPARTAPLDDAQKRDEEKTRIDPSRLLRDILKNR